MLVDLAATTSGACAEYGTRARAAVHGARALLARHAPGVDRRGPARRGPRPARRAGRRAFRPARCRARRRSGRWRSSRSSSRRAAGIYAGAVGYLDFAGNLDFCIAIRTIVIAGRRARVQAGAGIVADSNPAAEYEETRDKARALLRALELAQRGPWAAEERAWSCVIDNYDSFTYNLVQYLGELGADAGRAPQRRDHASTRSRRCAGAHRDLARARAGPRTPGISLEVIRRVRPAASRCSASASGTRRSALAFGGARRARAAARCTARRRSVEHDGARRLRRPARAVRRRPLPLAGRRRRRRGRPSSRSPPAPPTTASSWACATARGRSTACSSTRSRS